MEDLSWGRAWLKWVLHATLDMPGGVAERPIAPGCKPGARKGFVGSNPTSSRPESTMKRVAQAHIAQRQSTFLVRTGSPVQFRLWAPGYAL